MPTKSRKRRVLSAVRRLWKVELADEDADSSADEAQDDLAALYFVLKARRYLTPRHRVQRPPSRVDFYLTNMPDAEFKLQFRLSRPYFLAVLNLISDHEEFKSIPGKQAKMNVALHLLGLLKILGSTDGEGRSADFLSVGGHTAESLLAKRSIRALNSLRGSVIMWPDAVERREISARIERTSTLPHCIGFIDGTLFPLLTRPQDHGEDYFSRKASYAINGLVICDDMCRISYENVGWPGSSHDNRVWRNCKISLRKDLYFGDEQYLLGASAYQTSHVLVPAFKTSSGGQLNTEKTRFNKCLAKVRIRVEHCIRMLKGRFPLLRKIRSSLRNKAEIKATIELIRTCMILHNMAIADPIPDDWIEPEPGVDVDVEDDDDPLGLSGGTADDRREYLSDLAFDIAF